MRPEKKIPMANAVFAKIGINWQNHLVEAIKTYGIEGLTSLILKGESIDIPSHGFKRFFGLAAYFNYEVKTKEGNTETHAMHEMEFDTLRPRRSCTFESEHLGYDIHLSDVEIFKARKAAVEIVKKFQACGLNVSQKHGKYGDHGVFFFN